jgi:hypothetical protein
MPTFFDTTMKFYGTLPLLLGLALLSACSLNYRDVAGDWKAVAFYENGQTVQTPLDSVGLLLTPDGRYRFQSIGYYREAGRYRCSLHYLFLEDTTATTAQERMVQVVYVSPDTLKLKMGQADKEQGLFLVPR